MKKAKIILPFCFLLSVFSAAAQNVKLEISNLTVQVKDQKFTGNPFNVDLMIGKNTGEVSIFKNENTEIRVVYKLKKFDGTRRSNLKKTSIGLTVNYSFIHRGKTSKRKVEKIFYLKDDRTFEETESAAFMDGISNSVLKVSYTGKLPE